LNLSARCGVAADSPGVSTAEGYFRSQSATRGMEGRVKGGVGGGGARLTPMGREVLSLYRAMEDHAATAVVGDMAKLRALMVEIPPEY